MIVFSALADESRGGREGPRSELIASRSSATTVREKRMKVVFRGRGRVTLSGEGEHYLLAK